MVLIWHACLTKLNEPHRNHIGFMLVGIQVQLWLRSGSGGYRGIDGLDLFGQDLSDMCSSTHCVALIHLNPDPFVFINGFRFVVYCTDMARLPDKFKWVPFEPHRAHADRDSDPAVTYIRFQPDIQLLMVCIWLDMRSSILRHCHSSGSGSICFNIWI